MLFSIKALSLLSLAFTSALAGPILERAAAASPSATISNGVVVGTTTQYPGATATSNKFLGIPFAKSPPVRFGLPQAAANWNTPLVATSYKPICLQQINVSLTAMPQSEDCLYANVFTPPGTTPSSGKSVMLWIFGGNLEGGDGSELAYDGSSLAANHDVIVVTFNYRVSIFGFSSAPELPLNQQNVGFWDQRFALNWTANNIAGFGGDPSKITIFGESAGGQSVRNLIAYPPSPQIYRGSIMESEGTVLPGNGTANWGTVAVALGCPPTTGSLACLRAASGTAIQKFVNSSTLFFPQARDGVTYGNDQDIANRFAFGQASNTPVLLGTNGQELSAIPHLLGLDGQPIQAFFNVLNSFLGANATSIANRSQSTQGTNVVFDLTTQFFTQLVFQCPAATLAQQTMNRGSPTWRYYYNASFPNTQQFPGSGAYHSSEIYEVFGTYPRAGDTAQQVGLSNYMQTAWSNFAKNPTTGPGWTIYGSNHTVANLGSNGSSGEQDIPASQIDTLCPVFDFFGGALSIFNNANTSSAAYKVLEQPPKI